MQDIIEREPCRVIRNGRLGQDGYALLVRSADGRTSIAFSDMSLDMQSELNRGAKASLIPGGVLQYGALVTPDSPREFMDAIHGRNNRLRMALGLTCDADGFAVTIELIISVFILCGRFVKNLFKRCQASISP